MQEHERARLMSETCILPYYSELNSPYTDLTKKKERRTNSQLPQRGQRRNNGPPFVDLVCGQTHWHVPALAQHSTAQHMPRRKVAAKASVLEKTKKMRWRRPTIRPAIVIVPPSS